MERNAGTTIFGRLELIREEASSVGVQVFGPTWAVLDSETGELARACFLDAELLPDAASRDAFVAGLEAMTSLRDPTLVPQIYAGADEHGGAVVYEALAGGVSFDDLYDGTGSFDLSSEVGRLARQLARALEALHTRGQVHGLLTSACVFVGSRGPAVYQFGLAPLCDRTVLLRRVRAFGLPNLPPEVVAGGPFTPTADLYAWAVTVAQFAAGARGAEAIAAARGGQELPGLSPALRAAVQACLADEPSARPRDGGELLRLIELAGLGEGSGALRAEEPATPVPEDSSPGAPEVAPAPVPEASPEPAATIDAPHEPAAEPAPAPAVVEPESVVSTPVREPTRPTSIPTPTGPPIAVAPSIPTFTPTPTPASAAPAPSAASVATPGVAPAAASTASPPVVAPPAASASQSSQPISPVTPVVPVMPGPLAGRPMPPLPPLRPSASKERPPTSPPSGMSLPVTSFEEMLMTGDRQRRPPTIPPPTANNPAPASPTTPTGPAQAVASTQAVSSAPPLSVTTPSAHPGASGSSTRAVIELSPEDLLNESGHWKPGGQPSGKSASNLRRVRVLTDPVKRPPGEGSGLINLGRAPLAEDLAGVPETPAQRRTGEVIIGGTREELDAASRATTVRLDPNSAAAAIKAATDAAASAQAAKLASDQGDASDAAAASAAGGSIPAGSTPAGNLDGPTDAGPEASRTGATPAGAGDHGGTPSLSSSGRRRSSAVASSASGSGEPRDWGTIPPIAELVPAAPAVETPRPTLPPPDPRSKLLPILLIVAVVLLLLIFAAR